MKNTNESIPRINRLRTNRRSRFEIWAEVLEACLKIPRTQSWLLRRLRLKTSAIKEALSFLISVELIEEGKNSDSNYVLFKTSKKGEDALNKYYQLITKFFRLHKTS